jgi:hypothetical protein
MNYDNNNRGGLWKNDKRTTDKHPQLSGAAEVDGKQYWVSAWTSKGEGNKPIVSLSFKPKDEAPTQQAAPVSDIDLDDLPF